MNKQYIFDGMEPHVREIELGKATDRIRELLPEITTGPWMADVAANSGKNWQIAHLGASSEDDKVYIVTTDHVHCSEYSGDAKADAEFIALVRNNIEFILERLK